MSHFLTVSEIKHTNNLFGQFYENSCSDQNTWMKNSYILEFLLAMWTSLVLKLLVEEYRTIFWKYSVQNFNQGNSVHLELFSVSSSNYATIFQICFRNILRKMSKFSGNGLINVEILGKCVNYLFCHSEFIKSVRNIFG